MTREGEEIPKRSGCFPTPAKCKRSEDALLTFDPYICDAGIRVEVSRSLGLRSSDLSNLS